MPAKASKSTKKTTEKAAPKKTVKTAVKSGISVPVYNLKGESEKDTAAAPNFTETSVQVIHQAIRVYQAARRQGTVSTKTRGEVTGSTRKIFRQKGTGRARHGSIRAPIFVGGGIAFGPKPRNFSLNLTQSLKQRAFSHILADRVKSKKMHFVAGLEASSGKTKETVAMLKNMELTDKKVLFIIEPSMTKLVRSARNITDVTVRSAANVSFMDVLENEVVITTEQALNELAKRAPKSKKV